MSLTEKLVGTHNQLEVLTSNKTFMTTYFSNEDGWYYDPVGDEIFYARLVAQFNGVPVYELDFGDEKLTGVVKSHGLHLRLE